MLHGKYGHWSRVEGKWKWDGLVPHALDVPIESIKVLVPETATVWGQAIVKLSSSGSADWIGVSSQVGIFLSPYLRIFF